MNKTKHDKIVEILYQLSKNYKSYGKVYADHISKDYRCLHILSRVKRGKTETIEYYPDLWCKHIRSNKIDVFEVWHKQSEESCVEDILFSALTPGIDHLHIACLSEAQYNLATKLVKIILTSVFNEETNLRLDSSTHVLLTHIPGNILSSDTEIKKFLQKELKF